jgi:hypothetical protein
MTALQVADQLQLRMYTYRNFPTSEIFCTYSIVMSACLQNKSCWRNNAYIVTQECVHSFNCGLRQDWGTVSKHFRPMLFSKRRYYADVSFRRLLDYRPPCCHISHRRHSKCQTTNSRPPNTHTDPDLHINFSSPRGKLLEPAAECQVGWVL